MHSVMQEGVIEADSILSASGTRARGLPQDEDTVRLSTKTKVVAVPRLQQSLTHSECESHIRKAPIFLEMTTA